MGLNKTSLKGILSNNTAVFAIIWIVAFVLYLPAIKAGWVIDTAGWLYNIRHLSFWNYINNSQSRIPSLYQFTQFTTYIFYLLFNANPYAWHILMVTMHAFNSLLLFTLCRNIFVDTGIKNAPTISIAGVLLYTVSPHISEVIVWEASFHYLQGFMFILGILLLARQYLLTMRWPYAAWCGLLYFLSTWSLEVFYLTPWLILALGLHYQFSINLPQGRLRKTIVFIVLPQLLLFLLNIFVLRFVFGNHFAHIAENVVQPLVSYLCKTPQYIFHILLFGRFFSVSTRESVYQLCQSLGFLTAFYSLTAGIFIWILIRFKKLAAKGRLGLFLFVSLCICLVIVLPLAFPYILLVFYDRYTYFITAFLFMLFALWAFEPGKLIWRVIFVAYALLNIAFTLKLNLLWKQATYVDNRLLQDMPVSSKKNVLLLSMPENMQGVAMIGAQPDGMYQRMRTLFTGKLNDSSVIYDVMSFNMLSMQDGTHVTVVNDSTLKVTLNQWGTWWWYEGHGGKSYETPLYRVDLKDPGHWYEITLKQNPATYLILFQNNSAWKTVDMSQRNTDQY